MAVRTAPRPPAATASRPAGRTLHLLDVENLAGGTRAGTGAVAPALAAYRGTIAVAPGDHVVLGAGPSFALASGCCWRGARLVVGHGIDGADRALLAAVDLHHVTARYDRVVVASGDHAFCGLVSDLRARGLAVLVVARPGSVSRHLARLAPVRPLAAVAGLALAA